MPSSFILAVLATFFVRANVQLCRFKKLTFDVAPRQPSLCAELGLHTGHVIGAVLSNQLAPFRPRSTGPPDDALNCR
jgi:hypothetical protein